MADDEPYVRRSVKDLAAGLKGNEVGRVPITSKPARPAVKPRIDRNGTASVPPGSGSIGQIPNLPADSVTGSEAVPVLPARRTTDKPAPPTAPPRRTNGNTQVQPSAPGLPPRRPTDGLSPSLPPRKTSDTSIVTNGSNADGPVPSLPPRTPAETPGLPARRTSQASIASTVSAVSSISRLSTTSARTNGTGRTVSSDQPRVRAPVYDPSTLPPLPPKREKSQDQDTPPPSLPSRGKSIPFLNKFSKNDEPSRPSLPRRPDSAAPDQPARRMPPTVIPAALPRSERIAEHVNGAHGVNGLVGQAVSSHAPVVGLLNGAAGTPPPVPMGSRPDLSAIMHSKPKFSGASSAGSGGPSITGEGCLQCRDFSGPDKHAAKFPRQNVRSIDTLAYELTCPFPSLADKARAIFTWMHHNIAYDCASFFGGTVRPVTPLEVVRSGLAVCAGYAGLYADLAMKAGLECVVVGGHGKGYGHSELQPGQPCPPESQGHAWNAVKIDYGGPDGNGRKYWKLIDPCWGAGHLSGDQYKAAFNPRQFTDGNIDFGRKHFPEDRKYQYREDGRTITWQEYFVGKDGGPGPQIFSGPAPQNGLSQAHMLPKLKHIPTDPRAHSDTNGIVRFQFQRVCDHWNPEVNGLGKDLIYTIPTFLDGKQKMVPFETTGTYWWCDVHVSKLGKRGDQVTIFATDTIGDKTSRGMSRNEFLSLEGRAGWGGSGMAAWELI